jgi:hypothetical protein
MDARLLRYYNQELRYLREVGGDFAREFPKIASRLGMEGLEVTDPYVERLLEGCAFLAARVQLKQDAEFPRLSHRLLELIYPNFLAPVPSMLVAQITPVPDANLLKGMVLARDTRLQGPRTALSDTRCEFRTAQPVQLTPLSTIGAEYFLNVADLGVSNLGLPARPRSGVRITLQLPTGMSIGKLEIDSLRFFSADRPRSRCTCTSWSCRTRSVCWSALPARPAMASASCCRRHRSRRSAMPTTRRCCRSPCAAFPACAFCRSTSHFPSASCFSTSAACARPLQASPATRSRSCCCSLSSAWASTAR